MVSFYTVPDMDLSIETEVGGHRKLANIAPVGDLILKKLKLSFCEKFVMPNRKYFTILPTPDMPRNAASSDS